MEPTPAKLLWNGDTAFTVEFGESINGDLNDRVLALDGVLRETGLDGIVETVPTYRSLTVHLDPVAVDPSTLAANVLSLAQHKVGPAIRSRTWRIPVVYGGEFGIDLEAVASHHGIGADEAVNIHASAEYRVFMLGFLPGFAYLGGLDPRLALPRRVNPRSITPAGTISIGGAQALVASIAAPSGWHLLGRTPVRT